MKAYGSLILYGSVHKAHNNDEVTDIKNLQASTHDSQPGLYELSKSPS